jgi:hypothetical protein
MKILLAGEGPDDIGDWSAEIEYRPTAESFKRGVVEVLLGRLAPESWRVANGVRWKKIRKYRSGEHRKPETRNVQGLALQASEAGYGAVVFSRDRDRSVQREKDIVAGIEQSQRFGVRVLGGCAVEELEAWILALLGVAHSESSADAKARLRDEHGIAGREQMVEVVEAADLDSAAIDAGSLRVWMNQIRSAVAELPE